MELLEGENIRLRAIEPEDLELLYRWENHSDWWGFGSTVAPYSRYQLKNYIEQSHCDIYELKQLRLMIEQLSDAKTVGSVDLYDFDPYHLHAGVGILVDSDYQQRGIASEALTLLERYAFSFLRLHMLYAYANINNEASKKLFLSQGFTASGVLRDWSVSEDGFSDVVVLQRINSSKDE
jgi:diamine N-acetyltransferase